MRLFFVLIISFNVIFCHSQSIVSKSDAIADIDFYNATLETVHYNPWFHIKKEDYFKKTDSIKNSIGDSIDFKSFLLKLYSLTAALEDGHTSPGTPLSLRPELLKKQFLPFQLVADEQQNLFVKDGTKENSLPAGSQVISINGLDMKEFIQKANQYTGGLMEFKKELSVMLLSYYLFLHNIASPFTVTFLNQNRQLQTTVISEGVDFKTTLSLSLPNNNRPSYSFKMLENDLAYIDFVSMTGSYQMFGKFLDSCFKVMRNNNISILAIDLRKNSGGNSLLAELLLSYITEKEFSLMGSRYWKISQQYKDYLHSQGDPANAYLKQDNGSVWHLGKCGPHKQKFRVDTIFKGKVFILTGPFTFSSANMLADGVRQYKLATLIGEPTGESTNDFGEVYTMELPNTKVKVKVSTSFDVGADCKPGTSLPVIPDIIVRTSVTDKINDLDPVIGYIIHSIK